MSFSFCMSLGSESQSLRPLYIYQYFGFTGEVLFHVNCILTPEIYFHLVNFQVFDLRTLRILFFLPSFFSALSRDFQLHIYIFGEVWTRIAHTPNSEYHFFSIIIPVSK